MNGAVIVAILGACLLHITWVCAVPQKRTSSKYERLDVDAILSNDRTVNNYVNCILEKGPCTPEGRDLKENIPLALKNGCFDCNSAQKIFIRKTAIYVMNNRPDDWKEISKKYNPTGQYHDTFNKFLAEG